MSNNEKHKSNNSKTVIAPKNLQQAFELLTQFTDDFFKNDRVDTFPQYRNNRVDHS
ncbi:MAG: hypothetical protein WC748_06500 [Legionellales bacterium]|jgi:hypothetical protein